MANLKLALRSIYGQNLVDGQGYFPSYLNNVYNHSMKPEHQAMFNHGSGSELESKAAAVHSSSMLSYNFFSWIDEQHPFEWDGVCYTKVYFEVQLRTLSCRSNPANMDVVLEGSLYGKRVLLFIESKFLEYMSHGKAELSDSYLNPDKYYVDRSWNSVAYEVRVYGRQSGRYNEGIKQSFCHLAAMDALHSEKALAWFNKNNVLQIDNLDDVEIRFMNAIFSPHPGYKKEHGAYTDYKELYEWFQGFIKSVAEWSIQPQWYSYTDLWNAMRFQLKDSNRIDYLQKKYMDFASHV